MNPSRSYCAFSPSLIPPRQSEPFILKALSGAAWGLHQDANLSAFPFTNQRQGNFLFSPRACKPAQSSPQNSSVRHRKVSPLSLGLFPCMPLHQFPGPQKPVPTSQLSSPVWGGGLHTLVRPTQQVLVRILSRSKEQKPTFAAYLPLSSPLGRGYKCHSECHFPGAPP